MNLSTFLVNFSDPFRRRAPVFDEKVGARERTAKAPSMHAKFILYNVEGTFITCFVRLLQHKSSNGLPSYSMLMTIPCIHQPVVRRHTLWSMDLVYTGQSDLNDADMSRLLVFL